MQLLPPREPRAKVEHALYVARLLTALGLFVAVVGVTAIVWTIVLAITGDLSWNRALVTAFGLLAATVLSGAAAYASGTNVGLTAERFKSSLDS